MHGQQIKIEFITSSCIKSKKYITQQSYMKKQKTIIEKSQKESPKETPKESLKETPKEIPKELPKEPLKESLKETPKETPKEPLKESPKETPKESLKVIPKESLKESLKGIPKESPKESLKESLKGIPKESLKGIPKETPKKSLKNEIAINDKKIKFVDLFCGIGSFHYSFKKMGWECVMACDIEKSARDTYNGNYNIMPLDDICEIDPKNIGNYDILCAGFPCQPFSQAGKHLGFNDERGTMFAQVMKFVIHHKPKVIILENVQGLLNHDDGRTFEKIQLDIKNENYDITYKILKCSDYGIPQMRKRLFIIGIKKDIQIKSDIHNIFDLKKYERNATLSSYMDENFEKDIAFTIRCGGKKSPINDKHNWDGYIVNGEEYRLTINDALKLQGFPQNFVLCGSESKQWKLLGNTIPTIFTEIIGNQINDIVFDKISEYYK